MKNFPIIDADGHVTESNESLRKHLKKEYRNRPLMHSEAWDRSFGGTLGKRNEEPKPNSRTWMSKESMSRSFSLAIFHSTPKRRPILRRTLPEPTTIGWRNFAQPILAG